MTRLALLRHGHTAWNRAGRIQGRTDIPLDAEAIEDLSRLTLPADWHDAHLVASPLLRAKDTARLVTGQTPEEIPDLIEMNWGAWEGKKGVDLRVDPQSGYRDIETWGWDFCPPSGERLSDLRTRLQRWLDSVQTDTLAVCHIGVMRVILAIGTGWNFQGPAPFRVKRNRLYILEKKNDRWTVAPEPVRLENRE